MISNGQNKREGVMRQRQRESQVSLQMLLKYHLSMIYDIQLHFKYGD